MAHALYKARQANDRSRIAMVLTSPFLSVAKSERLISQIVEREAEHGFQLSRRRYLSIVGLKTEYSGDWYSVRNGYELHHADGDTWEEVFCHVDETGTNAAIVDITFGPFARNSPRRVHPMGVR